MQNLVLQDNITVARARMLITTLTISSLKGQWTRLSTQFPQESKKWQSNTILSDVAYFL